MTSCRRSRCIRRLQQLFPTSSEAVLSAAPLGGLLLERGATLPALAQFDGYLRAAPAGVLVPEALYGRGRALRALGQATEERQTWRSSARCVSRQPLRSAGAAASRRSAVSGARRWSITVVVFLAVGTRALAAPATVEIAVVGTAGDLQRVRGLIRRGRSGGRHATLGAGLALRSDRHHTRAPAAGAEGGSLLGRHVHPGPHPAIFCVRIR